MLIWVVIIIVAFWLISKHQKTQILTTKEVASSPSSNEIKEESVFKAQTAFEEKLQQTYLPDAIFGRDMYMYKSLIRGWYSKLAGQYRYDEKMTQKLRNDWLAYMTALEDRATYNYLSLETWSEDEKKSDSYREDHVTASKKAFAIEDAFAAAIGGNAVSEVEKARDLGHGSISRQGELAPDGFEYDFRDELKPKKSK